jgi:hypothetical protein
VGLFGDGDLEETSVEALDVPPGERHRIDPWLRHVGLSLSTNFSVRCRPCFGRWTHGQAHYDECGCGGSYGCAAAK